MSQNNQRGDMENSGLVNTVQKDASVKKVGTIDTVANISYSLAVGGLTDLWSGLNFWGMLASRGSSIPLNAITGGPYGFWREKIYQWTKTNKESGRLRKYASDLLAFNTFQVPVYAVALSIGSLCSQGFIDWGKVKNGTKHLAELSPLIGPTLGIYTDVLRRVFNVSPASEGAYRKSDNLEGDK